MADFSFVTARIATGAKLETPDDAKAVVAAGITHIVDCRDDFDDTQLFNDAGALVMWAGVPDDGKPKPPEWFAKGAVWGYAALALVRARVLFHCAMGRNRGPSQCYFFLRSIGFDAATAERMVRDARPIVTLAYKADADAAIAALGYA